jgi:hypothetical protein
LELSLVIEDTVPLATKSGTQLTPQQREAVDPDTFCASISSFVALLDNENKTERGAALDPNEQFKKRTQTKPITVFMDQGEETLHGGASLSVI